MTKDTKNTQPKEAEVMASILKEMGVVEYEPGVINQMLEFTYRYVTQTLDDARAFANYAKKSKTIEKDDVKLAISMQVEKNLTTPPPRDLLLEIGRTRNSNPLPPIKSQCGIRLPPDRYCLSACNMQLKAPKKGPSTRGHSISSGVKVGGKGSAKVSVLKSAATPTQKVVSVNRPLIKVTPGPPGGSSPKIQISSGPSTLGSMKSTIIKTEEDSMKRKREDDDDYDAD